MPSETTPVLSMPYIQAAQAQKHVTHNEALKYLDIAVQLVVQSATTSTPPASPQEGDRYIVASGATGVWASHIGEIAIYEAGAFWFLSPQPGWRAYVRDQNQIATCGTGNLWTLQSNTELRIARLAINTAIDANNQLSLSGQSTLLSHAGNGHQLVLNKSAGTDTASMLFQTGFSGRAEIGTTGNDDLSVKISADGSNWVNALQIDGTSGQLETLAGLKSDQPIQGLAVMQSATDTTAGRLMRADFGYSPGNILGSVAETSGVPTGALIEQGSTAQGSYTRFADGTQICSFELTADSAASVSWSFPQAFATVPTACTATAMTDQPQFASCHTLSATQVAVDCWNTSGVRQATAVKLMALGRWF